MIAAAIDHTCLAATATEKDIRVLCAQAVEYGFASVCVNPFWVEFCAQALTDTDVRVCTVVGFPLGANGAGIKRMEAREVAMGGAHDIDMVINIGALLGGNLKAVREEIAAVRQVIGGDRILKVILETAALDDDAIRVGCSIAEECGANYVKTSTGFYPKGGATVEAVRLMRATVGPRMGVKASGGIKDFDTARAMMLAGATRLGCSAGVQIMQGASAAGEY